jgi:serine/threonine protein kinase/formylglycine-generating enzyme required for sulfatase activity
MDSTPHDDVICDLLIQLAEDDLAGGVRSLGDYLRRFPGHEVSVAREYVAFIDNQRSARSTNEDLSLAPTHELIERLREARGAGLRYRIEREIARGGMGSVLQVHDTELERDLAMKVHLRTGSTSANRFLREAKITGRLNHPGVVPVHEMGETADGRLYFTMRLVEGRTFRDVIQAFHCNDPEWSLSRALEVVVRVCDTMAFAHSRGVLHRDLKPSNVMVGSFGEVYVMDWGVARSIDDHAGENYSNLDDGAAPEALTLDGDVIGTPAYMAPEQALGKLGGASTRSDIYSVGALLYHLLAGEMPYSIPGERTSSRVILERVRVGELRSLNSTRPTIPKELVAIQEMAMARDPSARYGDMREMARDLRAFLDVRVVGAYATSPLRRLAKWVRRNRGLSMGCAGAALASIAALGAFEVRNRERERVINLLSSATAPEAIESAFLGAKPVDVSTLPLLRHLLDDARKLLANRDELEQELERLRSNALPLDPSAPAEAARARAMEVEALWERRLIERFERVVRDIDAGVGSVPKELRGFYVREIERHRDIESHLRHDPVPHLTFRFEDPLEEVLFTSLSRITLQFAILEGSESKVGLEPLLANAIQRVEAAEALRPADFDARWEIARQTIASDPRFAGLDLRIRSELVPIGLDPESQLPEFAHLLSGEVPTRGEDERLVLTSESGIVLVLIPPGTFALGSQSRSQDLDNYDAESPRTEVIIEAMEMRPYFIGKYEITQAQWKRLTTRNPSEFRMDSHSRFIADELHPVEFVSQAEAVTTLSRFGLTVPSEAQWEFAARGGTTTRYYTGTDLESVAGHANIGDLSALAEKIVSDAHAGLVLPYDDGFPAHARVDAMRPNPYGLHHVLGNVSEWCLDNASTDLSRGPYNIIDQSHMGESNDTRPIRGGNFALGSIDARVSARRHSGVNRRNSSVGVRAALTLMD